MYSNTRRKSGRKFVLDIEIPDNLEKKVRKIIIKERQNFKDLIKDHVNKRKFYENNKIVNAEFLDENALNLRIKYLEYARNSLFKIISTKGDIYNQTLQKIDQIRKDELREIFINETRKNEEEEITNLNKTSIDFERNIQELIMKINQYKEEYDKKSQLISTSS